MNAVGLYVHVPFCTTKCGYCDFYSLPLAGRDTSRLVDALLVELEHRAAPLAGRFRTVFFGGGTPTLLPPHDLERLLAAVAALAGDEGFDEFTVEANPATLNDENAALLVDAGVGRISFGAQSFHRAELDALERIHDPDDVPRSVALARRAGLEQINLDLIFGIPGQTCASWAESLRRALELEPDHLALYGLTYEPGTPLKIQRDRGRITPCDEQLEADLYTYAIDSLAAAGFEHYEISNFARPHRRCRHNLAYWNNDPYVGIGPSAASFLDRHRTRNVPDLGRYVAMIRNANSATIESETLDSLSFAGETAMLTLRLTAGIDRNRFHQTTGFDPVTLFADPIARHTAAGLLAADQDHIRLTPRGRLLADPVIADFLAPEPVATV